MHCYNGWVRSGKHGQTRRYWLGRVPSKAAVRVVEGALLHAARHADGTLLGEQRLWSPVLAFLVNHLAAQIRSHRLPGAILVFRGDRTKLSSSALL